MSDSLSEDEIRLLKGRSKIGKCAASLFQESSRYFTADIGNESGLIMMVSLVKGCSKFVSWPTCPPNPVPSTSSDSLQNSCL
ncbi:hypothetical protein CEXT_186051 [Caerostris extrusa]|uniref:Uncharacterized protein n=1 Tax=Caerostris extrusa TaxID=172846 RepID=A0AAV4MBV7_CAEEX|nr:hypothetical protein CEXT_186051 [Caerostris extrusa]